MSPGSMSDPRTSGATANATFTDTELVACDFTYLPIVDDELPQVPQSYTRVYYQATDLPKPNPKSHCRSLAKCICKPLSFEEPLLSPP